MRVDSGPDNDEAYQYCQMVRARLARRTGVREKPVPERPSSYPPALSLDPPMNGVDHRVHRLGGGALHPAAHRRGHSQDRQAAPAAALSDHHHQRRHPNVAARNTPSSTRNPHPSRVRAGVLSKMSKLRCVRVPCRGLPGISPSPLPRRTPVLLATLVIPDGPLSLQRFSITELKKI